MKSNEKKKKTKKIFFVQDNLTKWDKTALDASLTGHLLILSESMSTTIGGIVGSSPEPWVASPLSASRDPEGRIVLKGDELELM